VLLGLCKLHRGPFRLAPLAKEAGVGAQVEEIAHGGNLVLVDSEMERGDPEKGIFFTSRVINLMNTKYSGQNTFCLNL
jgi:hypothetical protein